MTTDAFASVVVVVLDVGNGGGEESRLRDVPAICGFWAQMPRCRKKS